MSIAYRPEEPDDRRPVFKLTEAAFKDMPFSDGDEQELVDRLRKDGDLALSLVAEKSEGIIGHIACSPLSRSAMAPKTGTAWGQSLFGPNCRARVSAVH